MKIAKPLKFTGASPARARFGLVLIHGRWGQASDILQLGEALGLPDVACVAPEAATNSWWPVSFVAPHAELDPWLDEAFANVTAAIAALTEAGLPRERIGIAGFSQGACLTLEYVARHGGPFATVVACSGGLLGTSDGDGPALPELNGFADKRFDYDTDLTGLPIRISNHLEDPHIPMARVRRSIEVLEAMGARVTAEFEPGSFHGVLDGDIATLRAAFNKP